jgi:hypothetical protein
MGSTYARRLSRQWRRTHNLGSRQLPHSPDHEKRRIRNFLQSKYHQRHCTDYWYAFVDDTDLVQTGKNGSGSSLDVLKKMQEGLDLWEGLVRAT